MIFGLAKDDPLWGHLLVVVPIAHLVIASLHLVAYCLGFGANLSAFVTPGDIFTMSVSKLVLLYTLGGLLPAIGFSLGRTQAKREAEKIETAGSVDDAARLTRRALLNHRALELGMLILAAGTTTASIILWWKFDTLSISGFFMAFAAAVMICLDRARGLTQGFLVAIGLAICLGWTLTITFDDGAKDRRLTAAEASHLPRCREWAVIKPIGERLLGIDPQGSKALISTDCELALSLPKPRALPRLPWLIGKPSTPAPPS